MSENDNTGTFFLENIDLGMDLFPEVRFGLLWCLHYSFKLVGNHYPLRGHRRASRRPQLTTEWVFREVSGKEDTSKYKQEENFNSFRLFLISTKWKCFQFLQIQQNLIPKRRLNTISFGYHDVESFIRNSFHISVQNVQMKWWHATRWQM